MERPGMETLSYSFIKRVQRFRVVGSATEEGARHETPGEVIWACPGITSFSYSFIERVERLKIFLSNKQQTSADQHHEPRVHSHTSLCRVHYDVCRCLCHATVGGLATWCLHHVLKHCRRSTCIVNAATGHENESRAARQVPACHGNKQPAETATGSRGGHGSSGGSETACGASVVSVRLCGQTTVHACARMALMHTGARPTAGTVSAAWQQRRP